MSGIAIFRFLRIGTRRVNAKVRKAHVKRQNLFLIFATIAAFLLVVAFSNQVDPIVRKPTRIARPISVESKRELVGVNSCSASACHGGVETGARLSEAATWRALDPHARAYATLLSKESRRIAERLWDGQTQAHDAALCLKCHVHSNYEQASPNFRKQDGVGCESCHGAAGEWLTPHYRPNWKTSLGMIDTKRLYDRANVCATCHVGTPDANVDHEMIAAGHPALRFEFATYFANLPPHWDVAKDRKANAGEWGFDFQAWVIGQWVSSATASELLAHRAADEKVWPEFAELDCFSCHHDLQGAGVRKAAFQKDRPGKLRRNEWHHAMSEIVNHQPTTVLIAREPEAPLDLIKDRIAFAQRELKHAARQREFAKAGHAGAHQIAVLKVIGQKVGNQVESLDFDFASQFYLAISASPVRSAFGDVPEKLRKHVQFPPGYASPKRSH